MQSVVTYEKPLPHLTLSEWDARVQSLKGTAEKRRNDAFDLRHSSHQLRNETRIRSEWDTYHNNNRLRARVYEIEQWKLTIQEINDLIEREMALLKEEKASSERELEQLNFPLQVCAESLSNRDGRQSTELTYDRADTELKKELCVTESNKKMLIERCQSTWDKINSLEAMKFRLQLDLNDKNEALMIDKDMLSLDKECANISFKTDSLKTPPGMLTYEQWLEKCEDMKKSATAELGDTLRLREGLFVARSRARNALQAQTDVTNHNMRKRIYETQRARNELQWQKLKIQENMDQLTREIKTMSNEFTNKLNALKVAETRLETRCFRPGTELCNDDADQGLKEEVKALRETIKKLQDKLDCAKTTFNALETTSRQIAQDLADKERSLSTDIQALEMRAALEPKKSSGTGLILTSLEQELPSMDMF